MKSILKSFHTIFYCVIFLNSVLAENLFRCDYNYKLDNYGWFKFHRIPATWANARARCEMEGAVLASPVPELITRMKYIMTKNDVSYRGIFTGIHATFSKGDFFTIDGISLNDIPITWDNAEPNNYNNEEDCIAMRPDGTLADVKCEDTYPYICFKQIESLSITNCGTVDKEYKLEPRTGSCYKFHRAVRTWSRAHMTCAAEGGYLAIINSPVEATVLKELYARNPEETIKLTHFHDIAYVGFVYWNETGTFTTIKGETLSQAGYETFEKNQPDNAAPGEYCGSMFRSGGLNDAWCHFNHPFICEKNPNSLRC